LDRQKNPKIVPKCVTWAENLSLVNGRAGPPQKCVAPREINITESLLVHGATTGLEARW
jgi:hypothetical protein